MLSQILKSPIIQVLGLVTLFIIGLKILIKGEIYIAIRGTRSCIKEPIKGIPARIIGGLTCLWSITLACHVLKIIKPEYDGVVMYIFITSFIVSMVMALILGLINF